MTNQFPKVADWFVIAMIGAVLLAWMFPTPGAEGGWLHPDAITKAGVALIFFLHGVSLPFTSLRSGVARWPAHLLIQACTFLMFPAMGLAIFVAGHGWMPADLRLGFFYLCALPSTVSSSVALTAAARGNVAVAVFNATISSVIGIFITPLWVSLITQATGSGLQMGNAVLELVCWLLVPLLVGQGIRPLLRTWAARNKRWIGLADRWTILLLVYTSFCDSFAKGIWSSNGPAALVSTLMGSAILFAAALALTTLFGRALGLPDGERTAAIFCGSKKSLAAGVATAQLLFADHPGIGLILLPILIYHPMQLIVCGVLAGRWGNEAAEATSGDARLATPT